MVILPRVGISSLLNPETCLSLDPCGWVLHPFASASVLPGMLRRTAGRDESGPASRLEGFAATRAGIFPLFVDAAAAVARGSAVRRA